MVVSFVNLLHLGSHKTIVGRINVHFGWSFGPSGVDSCPFIQCTNPWLWWPVPGTHTDQNSPVWMQCTQHLINHCRDNSSICTWDKSICLLVWTADFMCRAQATFILHLRMNAKSIPTISLCLLPLYVVCTLNVMWKDTHTQLTHTTCRIFLWTLLRIGCFCAKSLKQNILISHMNLIVLSQKVVCKKGNYLCCHPWHKHNSLLVGNVYQIFDKVMVDVLYGISDTHNWTPCCNVKAHRIDINIKLFDTGGANVTGLLFVYFFVEKQVVKKPCPSGTFWLPWWSISWL